MAKRIQIILIVLLGITFMSCKNEESITDKSISFNPDSITIPDILVDGWPTRRSTDL
ncbi:MAG: hypothetical protein CSYNP_04442 [Syntrophus sp. SKADARSKE-3]|nr:hypothetical protein [Syntrophus sp. SKADARSKE-3]